MTQPTFVLTRATKGPHRHLYYVNGKRVRTSNTDRYVAAVLKTHAAQPEAFKLVALCGSALLANRRAAQEQRLYGAPSVTYTVVTMAVEGGAS